MKIEDFFMVIEDYQSWLKKEKGITDFSFFSICINDEDYEKHKEYITDYFISRYIGYIDNEKEKLEKITGLKIKWD